MQLQDKRILVTGAAGGIGSPLVNLLIERGARLCLVSRSATSIAGLQAQFSHLAEAPTIVRADITRNEDRRHLLERAQQSLGGIDILINLAGTMDFRLFREADSAVIPRLLQINLEAPMQLIHTVLPQMVTQGSGRIVNVGSMFGSIGFPGFATYSATKFALRGFSQALRRELSGSGVGVTYVSPRAVRTAFNPGVVHRMAERGLMNMDEADAVARQIVRAIEKDRDEAYLGFPEGLFARINGILPGLVDRALRKQLPALTDFSRQAE